MMAAAAGTDARPQAHLLSREQLVAFLTQQGLAPSARETKPLLVERIRSLLSAEARRL
jgi:hypothetical protein